MIAAYVLDGEPVSIWGPGGFWETNHEQVGEEPFDAIDSLAVGESYEGGGGASPTWTITRVADVPCPGASGGECPRWASHTEDCDECAAVEKEPRDAPLRDPVPEHLYGGGWR